MCRVPGISSESMFGRTDYKLLQALLKDHGSRMKNFRLSTYYRFKVQNRRIWCSLLLLLASTAKHDINVRKCVSSKNRWTSVVAIPARQRCTAGSRTYWGRSPLMIQRSLLNLTGVTADKYSCLNNLQIYYNCIAWERGGWCSFNLLQTIQALLPTLRQTCGLERHWSQPASHSNDYASICRY